MIITICDDGFRSQPVRLMSQIATSSFSLKKIKDQPLSGWPCDKGKGR
jgi:hypothetical protein